MFDLVASNLGINNFAAPDTVAKNGFSISKIVESSFLMRYANGSALLNDYFIRFRFLDGWKSVVSKPDQSKVFARLEDNLNSTSQRLGALKLTVPMAYIEMKKPVS